MVPKKSGKEGDIYYLVLEKKKNVNRQQTTESSGKEQMQTFEVWVQLYSQKYGGQWDWNKAKKEEGRKVRRICRSLREMAFNLNVMKGHQRDLSREMTKSI